MYNHKKLSLLMLIFFAVVNLILTDIVSASGISIDAGLTPAANRWIFRSQVRYMERDSDPTAANREMKTYMMPLIVAYGLRPDFTIIARQTVVRSEMLMMGQSSSAAGFADLFIMGKYKLARVNTSKYTIGVAPTIGIELPTGKNDFSSNSFDLRVGNLVSGRYRSFALDLNMTYNWNGVIKTDGADQDAGNELQMETALAYVASFGSQANLSLTPVLESSYNKTFSSSIDGLAVANTGEAVYLLSPGIKFTWSSFIVEGLIQFPLWQNQNGLQTQRATSFIIGIRLMN